MEGVKEHKIHILKPSSSEIPHLKSLSKIVINTTSKSSEEWTKELSPFFIGPVKLYGNIISQNFENGWQFAKVYKEFADEKGEPTGKYFEWASEGWNTVKAIRFPMGRGKKTALFIMGRQKIGLY